MANQEQLTVLRQGAEVWNKWRVEQNVIDVDLREADLREIQLQGVDLRGADLSSADLSRANLSGAYLDQADLRKIQLNSTNLQGAHLTGVDLGNAVLSRANLRQADLQGADLSHADLQHADLSEAKLRQANLANATLLNATLEQADLRESDLRNARLVRANLRETHLSGADLRKADLSDSNLLKARLEGAVLRAADLEYANLRRADLRSANLSRAYLVGADLSAADLSNADLSLANLSDADLWYATLTGANLKGAILTGAYLREDQLRDLDLTGVYIRDALLNVERPEPEPLADASFKRLDEVPAKPPALEEVSFTAIYPKEGTVETWHTLLVYAHLMSAMGAVRRDAQRFLDQIPAAKERTSSSPTKIVRGTELTFVPSCEGLSFNPERITVKWLEDYHRAEFRFRADRSLANDAARVQVHIYVGPVIVGTLKFAALFDETSSELAPQKEAHSWIYHQEDIFVSYSHKDTAIVLACKKAYEALGFNILIDVDTLRSGQVWNVELMRMISRASIFQLFWSQNSCQSKYCQQEWQYALKRNKDGFIRPVYWETPMPEPPAELSKYHFEYIQF